MTGAFDTILAGRRALVVVAVDAEANAFRRGLKVVEATHPRWTRTDLADRFDLVVSGVGKSNAAGATARALDPERHACALNLGIAGALPAPSPLEIGRIVLATRSVLADEGMAAPDGFRSLAQMNFPPLPGPGDGMGVDADARLLAALTPHAHASAPIATVSTCSANDALARDIVVRTGAAAEAMEGAAVATAAHVLGVPFLEARAISNTTGDRADQRWDIRSALDALAAFASAL
ncbi:MAG: futalosine hydrolase [Phycisphaerales bacterium]